MRFAFKFLEKILDIPIMDTLQVDILIKTANNNLRTNG